MHDYAPNHLPRGKMGPQAAMPQTQLDYRSPQALPPAYGWSAWRPAAIAALGMTALNVPLAIIVAIAPDLGAVVVLLGVPIVNFTLAIVALGCTPLVVKSVGKPSLLPYLLASLLTPAVLFVADVATLGRLAFPNGIPRC